MKKILLSMTTIVVLSLMSCDKNLDIDRSSSDVKIEISLSLPLGCNSTAGSTTNGQPCNANTPGAGTILVSNTTGTNDSRVLNFKVKALGADMDLRKLPLQFFSTGASVSSIINSVKLYKGVNLLDIVDGSTALMVSAGQITSTSGIGSNTAGYIFTNISTPYNVVRRDSTVEFKVVIDVKQASGNYPLESTLTALFTNADLLSSNCSVVNNQTRDLIPADLTHRNGSAVGEVQTLSLPSIRVVMNTPSYSSVTNAGNIEQVTYTIPVTIVSTVGLLYIGQTAQQADVISGTNAFAFVFHNSTAPGVSVTNNTVFTSISSSDAIIESSGYRIDPGVARHFTLTVTLITPSTLNSNYRVVLKQIKTFTNGSLTMGPLNMDLLPINNYQTAYQFINN